MLMNPKGNLDEVMAELRQEYLAVKAPAHLQALLSEQAEANTTSKRRLSLNRIVSWGLSCALLVSIVLVIEWNMHRTHPRVGQQAKGIEHVLPAPNQKLGGTVATINPPEEKGVLTAVRHTHLRPAKNRNASEEVAASRAASMDDFIALPASEGLPPASAISLVRMQIEQSALQQYGFEVPAETAPKTLLADFAVGEDGLPRAIRIIR